MANNSINADHKKLRIFSSYAWHQILRAVMTIDISTASIIKLLLGGIFTYFIFPAVLVGRDMLLHFLIQKFIITSNLNSLIRMCESDRWYKNNIYSKEVSVSIGSGDTPSKFVIDGVEVSYDTYQEYERNREFHVNRYEYANSEIVRIHNLIVFLTKHYKQAEGGNPIPKLRESYYESAAAYEAKREKKSNNSIQPTANAKVD